MEAIFLVGSVQALFFAVLVFTKQEKSIADTILGLWLISLAFTLLFPFFIFQDDLYRYINLSNIEVVLFGSQPIWLYLYVNLLTNKRTSFNKNLYLHIIPVLFIILLFIPLYNLTAAEKIEIYEGTSDIPTFIFWTGIPMIIILVIYIVASLRKIWKHKKNLKYMFSYEESVDLQWLHNLVVSFIAIFVIELLVIIIFVFSDEMKVFWLDYVGYLALVGFVFALGYFGYQQGRIFQHSVTVTGNKTSLKKKDSSFVDTRASSKENTQLAEKINNYVNEHKPWLNPKLSLYDLASDCEISTHQLSSLLNDFLKTNFYDYINQYRVEEVKRRLKKNEKQFTILAIALDSGFNSKASFNRIFKHKTGKTPSEFYIIK